MVSKRPFYLITIAVLMVLTPLSTAMIHSTSLHPNQDQIVPPITGFKRPVLDGIIIPVDSNSNQLSEWGDASPSGLTMLGSNGDKINVKTYSKVVNQEMFVGLLLPADIGPDGLSRLAIMLDRDLSGGISKGDVMLNYEFLPHPGQKTQTSLTEILIGLLVGEVFDGQSWQMIDNTMQSGLPVVEKFAKFVATRNDLIKGFGINIEFGINPMDIDKYLPQYPAVPQDPTDGMFNLNYNLVLDTNAGSYGFPQAPVLNQNDESTVEAVTVVSYDVPTYISTPIADVGISHIEVTQSTQTADNDYSLVKGKTSLARVFIEHDQPGLLQVQVTLTVTRLANIDGSLQAYTIFSDTKTFFAPKVPRRVSQYHSANFVLGSTITNTSTLILHASAEVVGNYYDPQTANNEFDDVFFTETVNPMNVYVLPVNNNTWADPILPEEWQIQSLQTYLERAYPIPSVNFIRMDWHDLGTIRRTIVGDIVGEFDGLLLNLRLNEIYMDMLSQRRLSPTPMAYPHQLHGVGPLAGLFGGGLSYPSWGIPSGNGRVAWSANAGSTMAHEINHNLGPGSWGRHVTGYGYGCGAPDGVFSYDGDWNSLYGDNFIHDLGWNIRDGLISGGTAELMTYCRSSWSPSRWIGGYRWERLLTRLQDYTRGPAHATSPSPSLMSAATDATLQTTIRQINGVIRADGSGALVPSFEQAGYIDPVQNQVPVKSDIILRLLFNDQTSKDMPIQVGFDTLEQEKRNISPFSKTVLDNGTITGIQLINTTSNSILSELNAKHSSYDATVSFPQQLSRDQPTQINWDFGKTNTTNLYAKVMYSPDGSSWFPLSSMTTDTSTEIEISSYPGGDGAQLKVVFTDGVFTDEVVAPMFSIAHKSPELRFLDVNTVNPGFDSYGNISKYAIVPAKTNTTVGSTLALKVHSQDELGYEILSGQYEWMVKDTNGNLIQSNSNQGSEFRYQFAHAGNYVITVKVTDPISGLSTTSSVNVAVLARNFATTKDDFQKFTNALQLSREKFGNQQSNQGTTVTETTTVTKNSNNGPLPIFILPVVSSLIILANRDKIRAISKRRG